MDLSTRLLLWQQLAESCGVSTLQQGLQQVWKLLLLCLVCRLCFRLGETHTHTRLHLPAAVCVCDPLNTTLETHRFTIKHHLRHTCARYSFASFLLFQNFISYIKLFFFLILMHR